MTKGFTRRQATKLLLGGAGAGLAMPYIGKAYGQSGKELVFWHSYSQPERIASMEGSAARFKEKTGVSVRMEVVPWSDMATKWTTAAAGGTLPNVLIAGAPIAIAMWEAGVARPLDGLISALGPDYFVSEDILKGFNTYEGATVCLPHYSHCRLVIYRKDFFEEAGISKAPETWEEFEEAARLATKAPDRYGMLQFWGGPSTGATLPLHLLADSNGGALINEKFDANINSPEVVEAIQQLYRFYEVGSAPGEVSIPFSGQAYDLFNAGKSAMMVDTLFTATSFAQAQPELFAKGALGFIAPPRRKQIGRLSDVISFVATKGPLEAETDEWMKFLLEGEAYVDFLHTIPGGMFPVTKAAAANPRFMAHPFLDSIKEGVQVVLDRMPVGIGVGGTYGSNPSASLVAGKGLIETMMQNMALNKVDAQTAADAANAELQSQIDRLRR
jgi:multiple sugar transport system substrate-binding protein